MKSFGWDVRWIQIIAQYTNFFFNVALLFHITPFILYEAIPNKMKDKDDGWFTNLDPLEMLMVFDILNFGCQLVSIAILLLRATAKDRYFQSL